MLEVGWVGGEEVIQESQLNFKGVKAKTVQEERVFKESPPLPPP